MRIVLTRYFGVSIAKSTFEVWLEGAASPSLVCEARETKFKDYSENFLHCSEYCLPTGTFQLRVRSSSFSPMTLVVQNAPGHRGCQIGYDTLKQYSIGNILIGNAKLAYNPLLCKLTEQKAVFEQLQKLVYRAFATGEEMVLEVRNDIKEPTDEEWKEWRECIEIGDY